MQSWQCLTCLFPRHIYQSNRFWGLHKPNPNRKHGTNCLWNTFITHPAHDIVVVTFHIEKAAPTHSLQAQVKLLIPCPARLIGHNKNRRNSHTIVLKQTGHIRLLHFWTVARWRGWLGLVDRRQQDVANRRIEVEQNYSAQYSVLLYVALCYTS